jgi:hypothetical protein
MSSIAVNFKRLMLGVDQDYTDVTSLRSIGVTYTNLQSKPMLVCIQGDGGTFNNAITLTIDGVEGGRAKLGDYTGGSTSTSSRATVYGIVKSNGTYSINLPVGVVDLWVETL